MDSLTQITLGAAAGEAVLGRKAGNRAVWYGAALGTLSDLDVLFNPLYDSVGQLTLHRGFSHSILFTLLAAPAVAWALKKLNKSLDISYREWALYSWVILIASVMIDAFNNYGTQLFQPFSDYPVSFATIFVIDPFFTLPLLVSVIAVLFTTRNMNRRKLISRTGLAISGIYLALSVVIKMHVHTVFDNAAKEADITRYELMTSPTPFNIFLWTGMAKTDSSVYAGLYSVFDDDSNIEFQKVDINSLLLNGQENTRTIKTLDWFSRGYYTVEEKNGSLYYYDLRFGRSDLWLSDSGNFVWGYKLEESNGKIIGFERSEPSFNASGNILSRFANRIGGE